MKRDYSKWCSVALIAAIYTLAGVAGWLLFNALTSNQLTTDPLIALLCADVLATVVVWAFGLLYENVSVYDPYWSVFPPVAFLLWAFYTDVWSLPVCLLLIASCYWGWRLTRNWMITFKGIGYEDWRYTKYRSQHPLVFHTINLFGLNMMPTLVVFAAMLPGLKLFEIPFDNFLVQFFYNILEVSSVSSSRAEADRPTLHCMTEQLLVFKGILENC